MGEHEWFSMATRGKRPQPMAPPLVPMLAAVADIIPWALVLILHARCTASSTAASICTTLEVDVTVGDDAAISTPVALADNGCASAARGVVCVVAVAAASAAVGD